MNDFEQMEEDFATLLNPESLEQNTKPESLEALPESAETSEILRDFQLGLRLRDTTSTPGWEDVLNILEQEVLARENDLLSYKGPNDAHIVALQRHAHAQRALFTHLQVKIANAIDCVNEYQRKR